MKIGDKVRIISDNENYTKYMGKDLIITHVARNQDEHPGYDMGLFPEKLYDLKVKNGKEVPFSLYDYELIKI